MNPDNEYVTRQEVANRLRVKPATVGEWARRGLIPVLRLSPKVHRFDLRAVVAALAANTGKGGGQ